jgi:beta-phosphoglucomutase
MLQNGNRLFAGNGYLGRRGVPDEAGAEWMPATIVAGLYDKQGDLWREPVNAPDPLYTVVSVGGERLEIGRALAHEQGLNFRYGLYSRKTVWGVEGGSLTLFAERFVDMGDVHRLCSRYRISSDAPVVVSVKIGINWGVRDLNGPHLGDFRAEALAERMPLNIRTPFQRLALRCATLEKQTPLRVVNGVAGLSGEARLERSDSGIFSIYTIGLDGKNGVEFCVFGSVFFGTDESAPAGVPAAALEGAFQGAGAEAVSAVDCALESGWERVYAAHCEKWDRIWQTGDVVVEGDDYGQRCLRYSLYHLHCIAPRHGESLSVPARGLSGQTYKGAVFWDAEMFIAPYFLATEPELAAQFIRYRIRTLDGARRKAAEYGFRGAFYAWESQETGDDACTDFNVTDVFTGRPVRTYFRDKQIHISADIVYSVKKYVEATSDIAILAQGALEMILECARFFLSYLYYSPECRRYEALDVIGPDEYHERVNNNAFTNRMIRLTFETARDYIALFRKQDPAFINGLLSKLGFEQDLAFMEQVIPAFYIPAPNSRGIIEQFDGYFRLEDCSIDTVRSRLKDPKEYWGCGNGVATPTQIIKQADVAAMLALFGSLYPQDVKKANLGFYEPRTEHGSSLSACMYALVSCETGDSDRAYPFFIKSAEIDLTGQGKHFAGLIYIGGTHPAANGGAWLVAIQGFCGLSLDHGEIKVAPRLPQKWQKVIFALSRPDGIYEVTVKKTGYDIKKRDPLPASSSHPLFPNIRAAIFDLDGVLVDTAKYHFLAWKRLAAELGFDFTEKDNERLKGVSRTRSLEILLEVGHCTMTDSEKEEAAAKKNAWYVEYLNILDETALLPGAKEYLLALRKQGVRTALGSASKNAPLILERLNIANLFDAVIDGNSVGKAKPDPEVFIRGAEALGLPPEQCLVFEDSLAGIQAAKKGGMAAIGVGKRELLPGADAYVASLADMFAM